MQRKKTSKIGIKGGGSATVSGGCPSGTHGLVTTQTGCIGKADHEFLLHRRIMAISNVLMIVIYFILTWFTIDPDVAITGIVPVIGLNLIVITFSIYSFTLFLLQVYIIAAIIYSIFLIIYVLFWNKFSGLNKTFNLVVFGINTGLTVTLNIVNIYLAIAMWRKCGGYWGWYSGDRVANTILSNINYSRISNNPFRRDGNKHIERSSHYRLGTYYPPQPDTTNV